MKDGVCERIVAICTLLYLQDLNGTSADKLLDKLTNVVSESRLKWIRTRIFRMYSYWTKAMKELRSRVDVSGKRAKKVQ